MATGNIGSWEFDIGDGVLKNHDLSAEILHAAYESTRAMDFVKVVPFGKHRGQSVTVPRVHAITEPETASIEELGGIPEDVYTISETTITVSERARSIPYTSLQEELLAFDLEVELQDLLREQMRLVLDSLAIAAFKLAKIYASFTNATTVAFGTAGAPTSTATVDLNLYALEEIVKYLIETLYAPPYDEDYIGLCRYKSLMSLRRDQGSSTANNWQSWHQYTDPESKYNGESGRMERVRLVETTHSKALANCGTGSVGAQALFFGKDAVAMAETTTPELRAGLPQELGTKRVVGWYSVMGFNIRWETANPREARVIVVDSQ